MRTYSKATLPLLALATVLAAITPAAALTAASIPASMAPTGTNTLHAIGSRFEAKLTRLPTVLRDGAALGLEPRSDRRPGPGPASKSAASTFGYPWSK